MGLRREQFVCLRNLSQNRLLRVTKGRSLKHRLADFLLRYRSTPQSTTGVSPAESLMKRQLRTRLHLLRPDLSKRVETKQEGQKVHFDRNRKPERGFEVGDVVRVLNTRAQSKVDKWLLGAVIEVKVPRNYLVKVGSGSRLVHADHLVRVSEHEKKHGGSVPEVLDPPVNYPVVDVETRVVNPHSQGPLVTEQSAIPTPSPHAREAPITRSSVIPEDQSERIFESVNPVVPTASGLRRSSRVRKPVQKLNL